MDLSSAAGASPAMAQWFALKADNPDAVLFLRMGDFYELFFTDAEAAAAALDIALTRRGDTPEARALLAFLTGPEAAPVYRRLGFAVRE